MQLSWAAILSAGVETGECTLQDDERAGAGAVCDGQDDEHNTCLDGALGRDHRVSNGMPEAILVGFLRAFWPKMHLGADVLYRNISYIQMNIFSIRCNALLLNVDLRLMFSSL